MSKMTSRELVRRTLEFNSPERIPRDLWILPWAKKYHPVELNQIEHRFPRDLVTSPGFYRQPVLTSGDPYEMGIYIDDWGCTFVNNQFGVHGEVKQPLVNTWEDLEKVHPPQAALTVDIDQVNAFCRSTDQFVIAGACPRPFERLQFIRGSQNLFLDLAEKHVTRLPLPSPSVIVLEGAGVLLYLLGYLLMSWALLTLGRHSQVGGSAPRPADRMVTDGPYSVVWHPMYAAALCISIGLALLTQSLAFLTVALVYLVLIVALMPFEEEGLRRAYGDQYVSYSRRVPRLVPFVY